MSRKIEKINELIKQEISLLIEKEASNETGLLTITSVQTTSDLRLADIWVSVYGNENKNIESFFKEITPSIQNIINKKLNLKYVPKITFKVDKSADYVFQIDKTLKKINKDKK